MRPTTLFFITIIAILLGGCASTQTPATPTELPIAQTPTEELPTETPLPSATPVPTATPTQMPSAEPTEEVLGLPAFEPVTCRFRDAYQYDMECGNLIVPEDRANPQGPTVKMHVAIIKSSSSNPKPDPVIYISGGGGANHLDGYVRYMRGGGTEIIRERDYIMYNQRGAKYASPYLFCPGFTELNWDFAGKEISAGDLKSQVVDFFLDCQDDLLAEGNNLEAYSTATNAADLNDLRIALGYEQVNLYGTSYGTRLILYTLRYFPEGVRSAIIDSVYPPQINYMGQFAANAVRAFEAIFEDCAADPQCNDRYPNLEAVFYQTVDALNADPVQVHFDSHDDSMLITGNVLMDTIYTLFYIVDEIANIPRYIYEASQGDVSRMEWLYPYLPNYDNIAYGVFHSFQCREQIAFEDENESLALREGVPQQILDWFSWPPYEVTLCKSWQSGRADPIDHTPVVSDVPTLVFAGRYDPITPPSWSQLAAQTLSNSFFYEFPGNGHGVMRDNSCGLEIGLQFINDPTGEPDASCLDEETPVDFK
ncbi:MAG: alpha/beta fold hydrolase [Anaerolineales bacterium]